MSNSQESDRPLILPKYQLFLPMLRNVKEEESTLPPYVRYVKEEEAPCQGGRAHVLKEPFRIIC